MPHFFSITINFLKPETILYFIFQPIFHRPLTFSEGQTGEYRVQNHIIQEKWLSTDQDFV